MALTKFNIFPPKTSSREFAELQEGDFFTHQDRIYIKVNAKNARVLSGSYGLSYQFNSKTQVKCVYLTDITAVQLN